MIIFLWIVVGTIVASTSIALLCYKRSEMTLSEIAEKLEKQESSPAQRASAALAIRTRRAVCATRRDAELCRQP
jgi:hypothetical protein